MLSFLLEVVACDIRPLILLLVLLLPVVALGIIATIDASGHLSVKPTCQWCYWVLAVDNNGVVVAGEIRVNEQLILTCVHTLMMREHNRLAHGLAAINPHWDDEHLYQVGPSPVFLSTPPTLSFSSIFDFLLYY